MAYALDLDKNNVSSYLFNLGLSREGRVKLFTGILYLRDSPDTFVNDTSRRLAEGSPYFWYDYLFRDDEGDGRFHHFWFVVSDAAAAYGVLRVVYVEERGA